MGSAAAFVRANTRVRAVPFVPELRLHVADEIGELWQRLALNLEDCAPPFWAFPWAGGQALARHLLDHRDLVGGLRVLDLGSGSGLVALAAAMAGATSVTANDIDPHAGAAIALNAEVNAVQVRVWISDLLVADLGQDYDVVLAGDVWYDGDLTSRVLPWLDQASRRGVTVLVGDPGRTYAPKQGYASAAVYEVPVAASLENGHIKRTMILVHRPDRRQETAGTAGP